MFSAYGDVTALGAYGTQVGSAVLMDVTAPVVALGLVVAAIAVARVVTLWQRRRSSTMQPATLSRPTLRVAA